MEEFMAQTAPKQSRIDIRVSEEVKAIIEKAAGLTGTSTSSYIINKALSSAKEDIREMETLYLSNTDRDIFNDLIQNPPAPNEALKKLMESDNEILD